MVDSIGFNIGFQKKIFSSLGACVPSPYKGLVESFSIFFKVLLAFCVLIHELLFLRKKDEILMHQWLYFSKFVIQLPCGKFFIRQEIHCDFIVSNLKCLALFNGNKILKNPWPQANFRISRDFYNFGNLKNHKNMKECWKIQRIVRKSKNEKKFKEW